MYPKQLSMSEVCLGRIWGGARVPYRNCKVFATCTHQLTSGLKNDQHISRSTLLRSAPVYELKRCIKHSTPKVRYKISSSNVHWQLVKRQHNLGPLSVRHRGTGQIDKKWLFIKCQMPNARNDNHSVVTSIYQMSNAKCQEWQSFYCHFLLFAKLSINF